MSPLTYALKRIMVLREALNDCNLPPAQTVHMQGSCGQARRRCLDFQDKVGMSNAAVYVVDNLGENNDFLLIVLLNRCRYQQMKRVTAWLVRGVSISRSRYRTIGYWRYAPDDRQLRLVYLQPGSISR